MSDKSDPYPARRTADLLIGRTSIPGAAYFLSLCEARRSPRLLAPNVATALRASLDDAHNAGDVTLVAATVMPDHVHLLFTLGRRLSLARAIGKFKAHTRGAFASSG